MFRAQTDDGGNFFCACGSHCGEGATQVLSAPLAGVGRKPFSVSNQAREADDGFKMGQKGIGCHVRLIACEQHG
jgi:hypothetical protein